MSSHPEPAETVSATAETQTLVGSRVDKYEIVRSIGRGGMGMVYEALNTTIGKRVAMKFVDAELAQNKDAVARFQREAQAASAVESAHIVDIFDSGFTEDNIPFIVMELLRGEDLGHRIKRCGRLELNEASHIIAQILRGLHRAHEAGIVHRDLKPDNVFLVDRDDNPNFAKILDFGISKVTRHDVPLHTLTRQGTVLGTPFYMSPEQAQALPEVDGRTDLWSVGAIFYECLSGHPPHNGTTYEQVIVNICMKDVEDVRTQNPAVPEAIALVIAKALTRDRADRFDSARAFLDALAQATGGIVSSRASSRGSVGDLKPHVAAGASGLTPVVGVDEDARGFEPTLDVRNVGSKVGWSTSSGVAVKKRPPRALLIIAGVAFAAGVTGAVLYQNRAPEQPPAAPAEPPVVTMELRSNVEGAHFTMDGEELEDRVLKGQRGETKTVRVEAKGYIPVERDVLLQSDSAPIVVILEPMPPVITPVQVAASSTSEAVEAATTTVKVSPKPPKGPKSKPTTSHSPEPPATTAPTTTGVAGGLQLKTH